MSPRDRVRFYVPMDCPAWRRLELYWALQVPNPPVLAYYSCWKLEDPFRPIMVRIARDKFAVIAALELSSTDTEGYSVLSVSMTVSILRNHY